jgi:hypothetical protein
MVVAIACLALSRSEAESTCQNLLDGVNLDWPANYQPVKDGTWPYARNVQWNDIADPYGHKGTPRKIDAVSNVVSFQPQNLRGGFCTNGMCSTYWYNYVNLSAIPKAASTSVEDGVVEVGVWAKTNQTSSIDVQAFLRSPGHTDFLPDADATVSASDGWKRLTWTLNVWTALNASVSFKFRNHTVRYDSRIWLNAPTLSRAPCSACNGSSTNLPATECAAWIQLFDATGGSGWKLNDHTTKCCRGNRRDPCGCHCCQNVKPGKTCWQNVTCSGGHITQVLLSNMPLSGTIPASVAGMAQLTALDLDNNRGLHGSIPSSIANMAQLRSLSLSKNALTGHVPDLPFDQYGVGGNYCQFKDNPGLLCPLPPAL